MQRLGIVDLGSNTARLVVFAFEPGQWFRLADHLERTRAGRVEDVVVEIGHDEVVLRPVASELSGGMRGHGFSVDLEYNQIAGEMIADNVNSGMYVEGETTIKKWQLEGGYMLGTLPLEFAYKRDSMDTDGYDRKWYANDLGVNYFFNKHKAKDQLVYRMESNVNGVDGDDRNQFVIQWQFVF